jgi:hypothetical protein
MKKDFEGGMPSQEPKVEEQEKQSEQFRDFLNELNVKIHDLVESKKEEIKNQRPGWIFAQIKMLVRQEVLNNPPYFYTKDGDLNELVVGKIEITDKSVAGDVAKLGEIYGGPSSTSVIEWNRKKEDWTNPSGHHFILATFVPCSESDHPIASHDTQIYASIPLEVAEHLVENEKIQAELGYYQGDQWYNEETEEYEHESAESFTEPKLKANRDKKYTEPWTNK